MGRLRNLVPIVESLLSSSASQRDIRVNHGGPAGGNVARGAGYSEHQEENGYVDGRIAGIYVNETLNHPTQSQGDTDPDGGGDAARSQSLQQDHSQHLPIRGAHRHADPDFMGALLHGIRDHSVQPQNSKNQTHSAHARKYLGL